MDIRQNSIRYDKEKQELHIVTCYNKLQYKTLWVQDPYLRYMRYLLYTKDPEVTRLPALRSFQAYCWGTRALLLVMALYVFNVGMRYLSSPSGWLAGVIVTALSLVLFYFLVRIRALWMRNLSKAIHRTKVPKPLRPTWEGIDQGFAAQPVFRQEVTITPESYALNTPYPGLPSFQCRRGEYFIRVVQDEENVYFLQFKDRKGAKTGYMSPAGLHFARTSYTDADWATLLSALGEMNYL